MFKYKNLFLMGLLTVALSMFMVSCTEENGDPIDPEDPIAYKATIVGGTMSFIDDDGAVVPVTGDFGMFYVNDVIVILAADPAPAGKVFSHWSGSHSSVVFYDKDSSYTTFRMPARDVTITAVFVDDVEDIFWDGLASVRFTWEQVENDNITHISAGYDEMEWWYEEIYEDLTNADADFSDIPLHKGIPQLPAIFNFGSSNHPNKGKYFDVDAGSYTAVCGVEDEFGLAEIVANYKITINEATATADGADKFFEIAFDVGAFLEGVDDLGWFGDEYDSDDTDPRLEKRKGGKKFKTITKKFEKPGATMDVTFYVIRRPKN